MARRNSSSLFCYSSRAQIHEAWQFLMKDHQRLKASTQVLLHDTVGKDRSASSFNILNLLVQTSMQQIMRYARDKAQDSFNNAVAFEDANYSYFC